MSETAVGQGSNVVAALLGRIPPAQKADLITNVAQQLLDRDPAEYDHSTLFGDAGIVVEYLEASRTSGQNADTDIDRHLRSVLLRFIIRIVNHSHAHPVVEAALQLCIRHDPLLEELVSSLRNNVAASCAKFRNDGGAFVPPSPLQDWAREINSQPDTNPGLGLERSLTLIKSLLWFTEAGIPLLNSGDMVRLYLDCVGSADGDVSEVAFATALTALKRVHNNLEAKRSILTESNALLTQARRLCVCHGPPRYADMGFTVLLYLLSPSGDPLLHLSTLADDDYWDVIRGGLVSDSMERQKTSLSVLRRSASLVLEHQMAPANNVIFASRDKAASKHLDTFVTLYETIVIVRYLNQIQEVINDLNLLADSSSVIRPLWMISLLSAALGPKQQYSIRRIVGEWIIQYSAGLFLRAGSDAALFLKETFLPWATLGSFFTATVRTDVNGNYICRHGEALSAFLAEVMALSDESVKLSYFRSALEYVYEQRDRMFSYSRAFVLQGLHKGLQTRKVVRLMPSDVDLVINVASVGGFLEIAGDYMTVLCADMADFGAPSDNNMMRSKALSEKAWHLRYKPSSLASVSTPDLMLRLLSESSDDQYSAISAGTTLKACSADATLEQFSAALQRSNHQCLSRTGLAAGHAYVLRALDQVTELGLNLDLAAIAIAALWDETEVQEYPREALIAMPRIVLHGVLLHAIADDDSIATLINRILAELRSMAKTRIYVFSALAQVFRVAVDEFPGVAFKIDYWGFLLQLAKESPEAKVEFQLEAAIARHLQTSTPGRIYESYYGRGQAYGYACIFHILNSLPQQRSQDYARLFHDASTRLLDDILQPWLAQTPPIPVFSAWKSTFQLQLVVLLLEQLVPGFSSNQQDSILDNLFRILAIEMLPRHRFLLEWCVARIHVVHAHHRAEVLRCLSKCDISNPKYAVSLIKISYMLAALPESSGGNEELASNLMTQLTVLAANTKIVIRHEAQWTIPALWEVCAARGWSTITGNPAFEALNSHIRSLESFTTLKDKRALERFDPILDNTLACLVEGDYLKIEPTETPRLRRADLVAVLLHDRENNGQHRHNDQQTLPLGNETRTSTLSDATLATRPVQLTKSNEASSTTITHQTKALAPVSLPMLDPTRPRVRPTPTKIIASLLQNPHNLGGVSRVGEILGLGMLYIPNNNILSSQQFTSVSVSSHLHLPITELKGDVGTVADEMIRHKREGWEVVGIEQTDRSFVLGGRGGDNKDGNAVGKRPARFRDDGRTVLLLGSEREGIPGELLALCDWCVEIPQMGVTRSMNVQTAAAVVLWEVGRQRGVFAPRGS